MLSQSIMRWGVSLLFVFSATSSAIAHPHPEDPDSESSWDAYSHEADSDRYPSDSFLGDGNQEDAPFDDGSGDLSIFYDDLAPYGDWFHTPEYGYVWLPNVDHRTWRPYVDNGHWVWSDYGWMWVSDYSWGWAPFHYGRWLWLDDAYWVWIPDAVWGPAWVSWRYTDEMIGWAPLPPGAYWYPDYGLEITVSIPWSRWVYLPGDRVLAMDPWRYALVGPRMRRVYYLSRPATIYRIHRGVPSCLGVDIAIVSAWVGTPVTTVRVSYSTAPVPATHRSGRSLTVYRPSPRPAHARTNHAPPAPRKQAPAGLKRLNRPPPPKSGVSPSQAYALRTGHQTTAGSAYASPAAAAGMKTTSPSAGPSSAHGTPARGRGEKLGIKADRREIIERRARDRLRREEVRRSIRTNPAMRAVPRHDGAKHTERAPTARKSGGEERARMDRDGRREARDDRRKARDARREAARQRHRERRDAARQRHREHRESVH